MTYTKGIRKIFSSNAGDFGRQIIACKANGFDFLEFNGNIFFVFSLGDSVKWEPTSLTLSDFEA